MNKKAQRSDPTLTLLNGNTLRVLCHGRDSAQRLTVIDYVDYTRGNPPPFTRHDFTEVFTVLQGRLMFQYLDDAAFEILPGESETVASGLSHTFWNPDTTPLHILLSCSPAGLERFFEDIHGEMEKVSAGEIPQTELGAVMEKLRVKHGIEQTAPAPDISLPDS